MAGSSPSLSGSRAKAASGGMLFGIPNQKPPVAGLGPAIHVLKRSNCGRKTWVPGTRPGTGHLSLYGAARPPPSRRSAYRQPFARFAPKPSKFFLAAVKRFTPPRARSDYVFTQPLGKGGQ